MKFVLFVALCVVGTLAVPLEQSKPITLNDLYASTSLSGESRIVFGEPADEGQFPWQVAVYFSNGISTSFCGGSLITEQWVLTAAHCVIGATSFRLNLGGITLDESEEGRITVTTTRAFPHALYNSWNLNNDIALIQLESPVNLTDTIQTISLPSSGDIVGDGVDVTVSGWGRTSDTSNTVSPVLNYVNLTTISNPQCETVYQGGVIVPSTICALGAQLQSTCNGDSGGPLITVGDDGNATLVGVVSFVSSLGCESGLPSGYVRTEPYLDWIASYTESTFA